MKVKKIIKENWKLESHDNLDNIKQQLSFNEQSPNFLKQYKYKMIFSAVSCVLIICLFIISGMFVGGNFDGILSDDPATNSPSDNESSDPMSPGPEEPITPDAPIDPSEPGGKPDTGLTYDLFIEELKNNVIISDYIDFISYDNEIVEDGEKIKLLCEFFNNLTYEVTKSDNVIYEHKISLNDWACIEITESCYVRIAYQDVIISYETNNGEIVEEVNKILK